MGRFTLNSWQVSIAATLLLVIGTSRSFAADSASELLSQARQAQQQGKNEQALMLADKAVALDPKEYQSYFFRAGVYELLERHAEAVADYDRVLKLAPRLTQIYDLRGSEKFKLGLIAESIADFDKYLAAFPERWPQHWKRGIAYYYAGRFEEGRKQFEGYQSFDDNDVENAVWRYLCMAPSVGVEKARTEILKIKDDRRVPMMQVYALYAGKAKPQDVMVAVEEGNPKESDLNSRLFYAHLYLGLYYEVAGDKQKAKQEIDQAEKHKINHYMWDVARVHAKKLAGEKK
jgi:lipoprotein NlpI